MAAAVGLPVLAAAAQARAHPARYGHAADQQRLPPDALGARCDRRPALPGIGQTATTPVHLNSHRSRSSIFARSRIERRALVAHPFSSILPIPTSSGDRSKGLFEEKRRRSCASNRRAEIAARFGAGWVNLTLGGDLTASAYRGAQNFAAAQRPVLLGTYNIGRGLFSSSFCRRRSAPGNKTFLGEAEQRAPR